MIDGRHISSILDVSTFRGSNFDSDRYLVATKFRLRISASSSMNYSTLRKLVVRSQKTAEAFFAQLSDKLRRSPPNLTDIGGLWAIISNALRTIAETVLGFGRPP